MPPYGIDSLRNRNFDAEGFFESPEESLYDPAFGNLNYRTAYGPAPYTGNIPLTSYRVEPGSEYLSGDGTLRNLGFMGDIDLPSFGGSGNPRFNQFEPEEVATGILTQVDSRFPLYDEFTVAEEGNDLEENAVTVDELGNLKQPPGFKDFLKTMLGFAIPGSGLFMDNKGIESLNQRLRNTDFGRSKNLMDYLDMKKYGGYQGRENARAATIAQARGIQKKIDTGRYRRTANDNVIDRGRGENNIASRAPKGPTGARRGIDARNKSSIDPAVGRRG